MSILDDTESFMQAAGQLDDIAGFPLEYDHPLRELRRELSREEYEETVLGEVANDPVQIADGCLDQIVVNWGTLVAYFGVEAAREMADSVGASNLSKVTDGKVLKREDGKILKPETYFKPEIEAILGRRGFL